MPLQSDPLLPLLLNLERSPLKLMSSHNSLMHHLLSYPEALENSYEHYWGGGRGTMGHDDTGQHNNM